MIPGLGKIFRSISAAITTYRKYRPLNISLVLQQEDDVDRAAERYVFSLTINNPAELANSIEEWGCFGQSRALRDLGSKLVAFTEPSDLLTRQIPAIDKISGRILLPVVQPHTLDAPDFMGLRFFFRPSRGREKEFHFIRGEDGLQYWILRP